MFDYQSPAVKSARSRYAEKLSQSTRSMNVTTSFSGPSLPFFLAQEETLKGKRFDYPISNLFSTFLENLKRPEIDVFELVHEYENQCRDNFQVLVSLPHRDERFETLLHSEMASWALIRGLAEDRAKNHGNSTTIDMTDEEMIIESTNDSKMSDKAAIDAFITRNQDARIMQLVIDWLESIENEDNESSKYSDKIDFYSEGPHSWENTLHVIKNHQVSNNLQCSEMDPDASIRTNRPLHDLDKEDENRLFKHILRYLRAGRLDVAKDICDKLGHHWLAAVLYGWVPFHDLNLDEGFTDEGDMLIVQGNATRDLWKYTCFKYSSMENTNQSVYEAAVIGALCGNLKAPLSLLTRWSDRLWLLTRASLDCLIEQELRHTYVPNIVTARGSGPISNFKRSSVDLPEEYWNNMKNFIEIFREADGGFKTDSISREEKCHQVIQKLMIIEDIDGLLEFMVDWMRNNHKEDEGDELRSQMCRFFTHLCLFLSQLELISTDARRGFFVTILEEYIDYLIEWKEIELVAPYVVHLPHSLQVTSYAKLLETITDRQERQLALKVAKEVDLDIQSITKTVVEAIRVDQNETIRKHDLSTLPSNIQAENQEDVIKIDALDWLLIDEEQTNYIELMLQSNALMRQFLLSSKVESARRTIKKLPHNLIDGALKTWRKTAGSKKRPSAKLDNAIREHLCHLAFSQAVESFDEWLTYYSNSKPERPEAPVSNRFAEKVAHQQALKQYELDLEQWREFLGLQAKLSADKIYNVLCFADGGWMVDKRTDPDTNHERTREMLDLRKEKIPQLTFILHTILHTSERYRECLQVMDVIASEIFFLYKEFTSDQLRTLLFKMRETSIALLDQGKDCCGY